MDKELEKEIIVTIPHAKKVIFSYDHNPEIRLEIDLSATRLDKKNIEYLVKYFQDFLDG